jgi:hypothetical protein
MICLQEKFEETKLQLKGLTQMSNNEYQELSYVPPQLEFLEISEIIDILGPALNCSGFGGSVSGCN